MAPPKKNPPKKAIGTNPNTGTTTFGGRTVTPRDPRTDPASGPNSFDNPLNNRGPAAPPKPMPSPMLGKTGQWIDKTFGGGAATAAGPPKPGARNTKKGPDRSPAAAAAVVNTVDKLNNTVGSAMNVVKLGGGKKNGTGGGGRSQASRPAGAPQPPKNSSTPVRSPASSAPPVSAPGANKPSKGKVGGVYTKTRAAYKSEKDNAPTRYETPEQTKARMDKSQFDMSMSGADVKKYRKQFLKSHPAAAKAVAKGTLSMGDINMTVRRLKKKGSMGAFGMKSEDAG